jgi:hypothetical protein
VEIMSILIREEWLSLAVNELRPFFGVHNITLPINIRVTCGFPHNSKRSGAVSECWADTASNDGTFEILITPEVADPLVVVHALIAELCHATAGALNTGLNYQRVAVQMGLAPAGPPSDLWSKTAPSAEFYTNYEAIIDGLGPYPHAALNVNRKQSQSTRMLKAVCPSCGYTVRLTQKWAAQGLPSCPVDGDIFNLS